MLYEVITDGGVGGRFALVADAGIEIPGKQRGEIAGVAVAEQQLLGLYGAGRKNIQFQAGVITSYSIHYTKLYELLGVNTVSGERRTLVLPANCELRPVTDDMALCHPSLARNDGRLALMDAEQGWFVRVNHITDYGTDPNLERMTIHPAEPLLFLNIAAQPGSTALIWEHIEDAPGKPCPNPRVVV